MKKILSTLVMCLILGVGSVWAAAKITINSTCNPTNGGVVTVQTKTSTGADRLGTIQWPSSWSNQNYGEAGAHKASISTKTVGIMYMVTATANAGFYFVEFDGLPVAEKSWKGDYDSESIKDNITTNPYDAITKYVTSDKSYNISANFQPVTVDAMTIDGEAITSKTLNSTDKYGYKEATIVFTTAHADNWNDFVNDAVVLEGDSRFTIQSSNRNGNTVTVVVRFTDDDHHVMDGTLPSATVTLTSKGDANSKATATITATSNLTPTFTKPADYNFGEIYVNDQTSSDKALYVGTKNVAASQAAPVSAGQTGASWTASLSGTNSNQFQLVNANPQYGAFEVIYKPTEVGTGTHTATLSISVTYTDAKGTPISSGEPQIVTLTGKAKQPTISAIVFNPTAVDFNEQVTGYTGSQKVTVSQQNVANVEYSWGETNAANVFSYTAIAGAVTISAKPTAPGNYNATLTATGDDTRAGQTGKTIEILPVSVTVGLASPVLTGGSNLTNTYYLTWNTVPYASTYTIYEVSGENKTDITSTATYVVNENDTKTVSIPANSTSEKTFVVKAKGTYKDDEYTAWSNEVTVNLNVLTPTGIPYLEIYTGTDRTDLSDFTKLRNAVRIPRKKVNLINTFDVNGKPLFDELYVFGETVLTSGSTKFSPATTTQPNNAVTPCYVFTKDVDGYVLSKTITNVNQATKQLPSSATPYWTIAADDNKKLYFTGFCPFGSNGYAANAGEEGIIYIKGEAGATVDVYLEDCQLYSRQHSEYGESFSKDTDTYPSFEINIDIFGAIGGGAVSSAKAAGTASAIVFECTSNSNPSTPFRPTVHTIGDNVLYSQLGCTGRAEAFGKVKRIGQYSASLQVRVTDATKDSYTVLSFDDKWPTDVNNSSLYRRTNGYLRFQKSSGNSPSIELGNENTVLDFNGGQIELENSVPEAAYYLNTLAICYRAGYALWEGMKLFVGYGLGQDEVEGEVNFNDGTVNAIKVKITKEEYKTYFDLDEKGYTTTLRCPKNTYITGGSHNSDVRACSAVDKTGGSPKDKKGNTLVKLDYQLPGDANIQTDTRTGLVKPESMPNTLTCVGCGEGGSNTTLDLEYYGKQSLSPDKDNYIHLWAPGAGRIEYSITSWVLSMTAIEAKYSASGVSTTVSLGGDVTVPYSPVDKVNNILYAHIDQRMYEKLKNNYKIPAYLSDGYVTADVKSYGPAEYSNVDNEDEYTIHEKIYYVRSVNADEWMMFSPPFHVSNVYVLETSSEDALANSVSTTITTPVDQVDPEEREAALARQAEYNLDFASILASELRTDMSSNLNRPFNTHYNSFIEYAKDPTNKQGRNYSSEIKKIQIYPFTGSNYDAHFFIYKSEDNVWAYDTENDQFVTDWIVSQPSTIEIDGVNRNVIMEQGGIYALQFPFCPKCEGFDADGYLNDRGFWDYWTGKLIVFEGYGPQVIPGKNIAQLIADPANTESNTGELRCNPTFAGYTIEDRDDVLSFYTFDNNFYGISEQLKAGEVYLVTNISTPNPIKGRMKSVDPETGGIIYDTNKNNQTSTPTIAGDHKMLVYTIDGGVGIVPVIAQQVSIYNAAGQLVTSQYLTDEVYIPLSTGIYLICGEKEKTKAVVR